MTAEPTKRQLEVLKAIHDFQQSHGCPITHRELADRQYISNNAVGDHLMALRRKGCVTWRPGETRTLRLTAKGYQLLGIKCFEYREARRCEQCGAAHFLSWCACPELHP